MDYRTWKFHVNRYMLIRHGLTCDEIPDWDYHAAWRNGLNPAVAADQAIRAAKKFIYS